MPRIPTPSIHSGDARGRCGLCPDFLTAAAVGMN
jgi:hypothetical protein